MANLVILDRVQHKLMDDAQFYFRIGELERAHTLCAKAIRVDRYIDRIAVAQLRQDHDLNEAMCWDDDADYAL
jgi:hypothetical protein